MLSKLSKHQWFTAFLLTALAGHLALYRSPLAGTPAPEWPLLVDIFITFPLAHALIVRPAWKDFLKKMGGLVLLGLAFGSYAIPDAAKQAWLEIDRFRLLLPGMAVAFEVGLGIWIVLALRRALRTDAHTDRLLAGALRRCFGAGAMARLMEFEARVWYYGVFMRRTPAFEGEQHFYTAKAGGNASNQLAWIMLMVIDIPLAHLLLHFMWSPTAAWVATALTIWGLVYMLADYRATQVRPVSLGADALHIRCGALASDASIPYALIEAVERVPHPERRLKEKRYFRHQGDMNVEIRLREGAALPTLFSGDQAATHAVIGVDDPAKFVAELRARLT